MKETSTHIYFWGSLYSQWYISKFTHEGVVFNCCEQWLMWNKAKLFGDNETADKILKEQNPKKQKELGRKVKNFDNDTWDQRKFGIVIQGNYLKFTQNESCKKELLRTDKILVEGSPYDKIWGVGLKWDDPLILDKRHWRGQNLLGQALMEVRNRLKAEE